MSSSHSRSVTLRGGFTVLRLALIIGWPLVVVGGALLFAAANWLSVSTGVVLMLGGATVLARSTHRSQTAGLPPRTDHG